MSVIHPVTDGNGGHYGVLVYPSRILGEDGRPRDTPRCHSFVRAGRIEFLADSTHALAGRTMPLPEITR